MSVLCTNAQSCSVEDNYPGTSLNGQRVRAEIQVKKAATEKDLELNLF